MMNNKTCARYATWPETKAGAFAALKAKQYKPRTYQSPSNSLYLDSSGFEVNPFYEEILRGILNEDITREGLSEFLQSGLADYEKRKAEHYRAA
jgi:hypothetical protein